LLSQYGWPWSFWNFPAGQRSQATALLAFEKCITGHFSHARSVVVLGGESTRSPAAHVECFVQEACPASSW
jgi:hypothetical protein